MLPESREGGGGEVTTCSVSDQFDLCSYAVYTQAVLFRVTLLSLFTFYSTLQFWFLFTTLHCFHYLYVLGFCVWPSNCVI